MKLEDSHVHLCEGVISPNTAWLSLNCLEKLPGYLFWGKTKKPTKTNQQNTTTKKDSSQSTTHFDFKGVEENWTMNKQSPIT